VRRREFEAALSFNRVGLASLSELDQTKCQPNTAASLPLNALNSCGMYHPASTGMAVHEVVTSNHAADHSYHTQRPTASYSL